MKPNTRRLVLFGAAVAAALHSAASADAQYGYRYRPPAVGWGNTIYAPYAGVGGQMAGMAQAINAQGNFMIQSEQARLERENVNQAKIETQKQAFEWQQYEKKMTPTFTDEQIQNQSMVMRRLLTVPSTGEITSGTAMNTIMPFLRQLAGSGTTGPPVPLSESVLSRINVTVPNSLGNAGMLRDGGHLDWPLVLRDEPLGKKLANELPTVVSQTANGTLTFATAQQVKRDVQSLSADLSRRFREEQIDTGSFLTGKRFLDALDSAVKTLEQPTATKLLNGTFAARGRDVQELVMNMTDKGLQFAPASPGNEQAYLSLYDSMLSFVHGDQSAAGFSLAVNPAGSFEQRTQGLKAPEVGPNAPP